MTHSGTSTPPENALSCSSSFVRLLPLGMSNKIFPVRVLPGLMSLIHGLSPPLDAYSVAVSSTAYSVSPMKPFWLAENIVCGESPMFFTVRLTRQNCPWALAFKYWSPTSFTPHLTFVTVKANWPSRTSVPIPDALAGVVGAVVFFVEPLLAVLVDPLLAAADEAGGVPVAAAV